MLNTISFLYQYTKPVYTCHEQTLYCMLYTWNGSYLSNEMNHKTIQTGML